MRRRRGEELEEEGGGGGGAGTITPRDITGHWWKPAELIQQGGEIALASTPHPRPVTQGTADSGCLRNNAEAKHSMMPNGFT